MKKVLLGTTAIVGASFMASAAVAAPEVKLSGYYDFQVGIVSQDVDRFGASPGGVPAVSGTRSYGAVNTSEVILRASDKLDSGLAWALKIELLANADATEADNADEVTLTLSGTWGQVFFGNDDGPADTMKFGGGRATRDAGTGGVGGDWRRWVGWDIGAAGNRFWSNAGDVRETSDATKIAYITPRFAGLQAGVSFTPDRTDTGRLRSSDAPGSLSEEDFWEFGLNYDQKFGEVRLALAAVGAVANNENDTLEDTRSWYLSGMVGFAGFTVGAGYGSNGESTAARNVGNNEVNGWDVAVGYNVGAWDFGVGYFRSDAGNSGGAGEHTLSVATIGATYDLGNGLSVYAEGVWFEMDSAAAGQTDNEGLALITGIGVQF